MVRRCKKHIIGPLLAYQTPYVAECVRGPRRLLTDRLIPGVSYQHTIHNQTRNIGHADGWFSWYLNEWSRGHVQQTCHPCNLTVGSEVWGTCAVKCISFKAQISAWWFRRLNCLSWPGHLRASSLLGHWVTPRVCVWGLSCQKDRWLLIRASWVFTFVCVWFLQVLKACEAMAECCTSLQV